ncbi:hypothetical protein WAF17_18765 [Bernardetia sp. ABR2-2B]|uniref:hypothetical protein n=1 Tax=Bernardetia sp. ABR2-2B TaxID=3127472 RepID=UPI0030CCFABE
MEVLNKIFRLIIPILSLIAGVFLLQEFDPTRSIVYDTTVSKAVVMHGDRYYRQSLRASYEYKGHTYKKYFHFDTASYGYYQKGDTILISHFSKNPKKAVPYKYVSPFILIPVYLFFAFLLVPWFIAGIKEDIIPFLKKINNLAN